QYVERHHPDGEQGQQFHHPDYLRESIGFWPSGVHGDGDGGGAGGGHAHGDSDPPVRRDNGGGGPHEGRGGRPRRDMQLHGSFAPTSMAAGTYTVTASYGGDANFNSSTSAAITQTINKGSSTTTVTSSPNASLFGQTVTITATVSAVSPAVGTPTGTVTFLEG